MSSDTGTIVVGADGSANAGHALDTAAWLATSTGCELLNRVPHGSNSGMAPSFSTNMSCLVAVGFEAAAALAEVSPPASAAAAACLAALVSSVAAGTDLRSKGVSQAESV